MKIVILPGLDGSGKLSAEFCALLTVHCEVQVVSYPDDLVRYDDILDWLEPRLPSDDYLLIAESFSGPLAIMIGASESTNLKAIVFVATFAKPPRWIPKIITYVGEYLPLKSRGFVRLAQPSLMGPWATHSFTSAFQSTLKDIPLKTIMGRLREIMDVDVLHQLRKLNIPSTYITAANDCLVPAKAALTFENENCTQVLIDGPHFILQANPSATANAILQFVSDLD